MPRPGFSDDENDNYVDFEGSDDSDASAAANVVPKKGAAVGPRSTSKPKRKAQPPVRRCTNVENTLIMAKYPLFLTLIDSTEKEYVAHNFVKNFVETSGGGSPHLWDVLGISEDVFVSNPNVSFQMSSLRNVFYEEHFIERSIGALHTLITTGKISCCSCSKKNARTGTGLCRLEFMRKHKKKLHGDAEQEITQRAHKAVQIMTEKKVSLEVALAEVVPVERQTTLLQCGIMTAGEVSVREQADTVWIGRALAGHGNCAGIPPSNVSTVFDKVFRTLSSVTKQGTPSTTSIKEKHLPDSMSMVKEYLKDSVKGMPISFGIDGGSSDFFDGVKILAVEISSPALPFTFLAHSEFLIQHENAVTQAEVLEKVRKDYGIKVSDVHFVVGDNASVNRATVKTLREKHGWKAQYTRCLPHCLNLVLQQFVGAFDARYKIKSFLKTTRSFFRAGGAFSRKARVVEFGLPLWSLDFADTRWDSLCRAVNSLMSLQSDTDMDNAEFMLSFKAAAGDDGAAEALAAGRVKELRVIALSECLEDIFTHLPTGAASRPQHCEDFMSETTTGLSVPTAAETVCEKLQNYLADVGNMAALCALHCVLQDVPTVFKMIQTGTGDDAEAVHVAKMDSPLASKAVRELTTSLQIFDEKTSLDRLLVKVKGRCEEIRQCVLSKEVRTGLVTEAEVNRMKAVYDSNLKKALQTVGQALKDATRAVKDCQGLDKLNESLSQLQVTEAFFMSSKFPVFNTADQLFDFLHVPADDRTHDEGLALLRDAELRNSLPARPQSTLKSSMAFWMSSAVKSELPTLSAYAIKFLARPPNNAGVERYFSVLNHMADSHRLSMKLETLQKLFFLRCNNAVMDHLAILTAAAVTELERTVAVNIQSGQKRKRESEERAREALTRALELTHQGQVSASAAVAVNDSSGEAELSDM